MDRFRPQLGHRLTAFGLPLDRDDLRFRVFAWINLNLLVHLGEKILLVQPPPLGWDCAMIATTLPPSSHYGWCGGSGFVDRSKARTGGAEGAGAMLLGVVLWFARTIWPQEWRRLCSRPVFRLCRFQVDLFSG